MTYDQALWAAEKPFIDALEGIGYTKTDRHWAKPVDNGDDLTHEIRIIDVSDRGPCHLVREHRLSRPDDEMQWNKVEDPIFNDGTGVRLATTLAESPFQFFEYQDLP